MKNLLVVMVFGLIATGLSACGHGQASTTTTTTTSSSTQADGSQPGTDASTNADANPITDATPTTDSGNASEGSGVGHVETTGAIQIVHDFKVPACQIGKPGEGLLNGYQMYSQAPEGDANTIHVRASDYTKDGTYAIAAKSGEEQAGQMMNNPGAGPLQLMFATKEGDEPIGLSATPQSSVEITISENGSKGEAKFTKYQNLLKAQFSKNRETAELVDGTITWTCGKVDRLAGGMSDAVNGMFKGIMKEKAP